MVSWRRVQDSGGILLPGKVLIFEAVAKRISYVFPVFPGIWPEFRVLETLDEFQDRFGEKLPKKSNAGPHAINRPKDVYPRDLMVN